MENQHTEQDATSTTPPSAATNSNNNTNNNTNTTNNNNNNNNNTASNNTITVADPARPKKPWKLRQTCDPCSEAKVKCDKGNPRCGRCDRLSYECVYSPARRIGRPRPRSVRSQDQDAGKAVARSARDARSARSDSVSVVTEETKKEFAAPVAPPPVPVPVQQPTPSARHLNMGLDETLPDCLSDDESRWSIPASASAAGSASASSTGRGHAKSSDAPPSTSLSARDGGFLSTVSSLEQLQSLSGGGMEDVQHSPYEYDCATVAVATLGKLTAVAGLESQHSSPGSTQTSQTSAAVDILADQIPHACRQAARILVCPCSADMDTALLAASLAAAILDTADAALRALKPAGHALDDEQHTVLALGTLPNISQVVTLFSHRYSVTQASRPPEALLLLAASLRTTLKTLAEETTNRFLESGGAPARVEVAAGGIV